MINLFKEKKSPKELGRILFVRCVSMTESFIKGMANYQQLCKNAVTDEDINGQELLIAHMWRLSIYCRPIFGKTRNIMM